MTVLRLRVTSSVVKDKFLFAAGASPAVSRLPFNKSRRDGFNRRDDRFLHHLAGVRRPGDGIDSKW